MKVRINRNPSLMMMVQKQTGTNTVQVATMVKDKIKKLEVTLPADVKIYTIFDTSKDITNAMTSLKGTLWVGIILVIFFLWFFLRQLFASIIIALTIPF